MTAFNLCNYNLVIFVGYTTYDYYQHSYRFISKHGTIKTVQLADHTYYILYRSCIIYYMYKTNRGTYYKLFNFYLIWFSHFHISLYYARVNVWTFNTIIMIKIIYTSDSYSLYYTLYKLSELHLIIIIYCVIKVLKLRIGLFTIYSTVRLVTIVTICVMPYLWFVKISKVRYNHQ